MASAALGACGGDSKPAVQVESAPVATTPAPAAANSTIFSVEVSAPAQAAEGAQLAFEAHASGMGDRVVRYEWSPLSTQPRLVIPNSYQPATTITAPEWTADYDLCVRLRAAAGNDVVIKDVTVHVAADDDPPYAEAFVTPRNECGETLLLVGQGHNEIMQGITYEWKQVGDAPRAAIDGVHNSQATCVLPEHDGPYAMQFEFHVSDGVNPPSIARAEVAVDCDSSFAPLAAGTQLKLAGEPGYTQALPRGHWEIEGSLALTPTKVGEAAIATLRFEYGGAAGVALAMTNDGARAGLRRFGLLRASDNTWSEPASSGKMELGEWPADQPLGFAFGWDGHELAIHWGPPGSREHWPSLPFPVDFPLASRPQAFAIEVVGGTVRSGDVVLTAR